MGHLLESDDLTQKTYFHNLVKQRDGAFPRPFFWKNEFFENQASLKRFIFVVPEYDNLTGVKTHRGRLENSEEDILERGVQIFGFGEGKGPHRGFGCYPVVAFSFFHLLRP